MQTGTVTLSHCIKVWWSSSTFSSTLMPLQLYSSKCHWIISLEISIPMLKHFFIDIRKMFDKLFLFKMTAIQLDTGSKWLLLGYLTWLCYYIMSDLFLLSYLSIKARHDAQNTAPAQPLLLKCSDPATPAHTKVGWNWMNSIFIPFYW